MSGILGGQIKLIGNRMGWAVASIQVTITKGPLEAALVIEPA